MGRITLENERLRTVVVPGLGAGVADLSVRSPAGEWTPLWRRAPENPAWWNDLASYLLAPWCNRIVAGAFDFDGAQVRLVPDWPDGTAIHGVVKDRPFVVLDRSPTSARLGFDSREHADRPAVRAWPWPFTCALRYELDGPTYRTEVEVTNRGHSPMPCGVGFHPYFARTLWNPADDVRVSMNVSGRYPCERMIPLGPPRPDDVTRHFGAGAPLGLLELDDVFAGCDGRMSVTWPASGVRARFECSPHFAHSVVYSPVDRTGAAPAPAPHFCLEPVSMVNDGFNLMARAQPGTGVRVLRPGESLAAWFQLTVEPVPDRAGPGAGGAT